jgi:pimeloyl-ACP methyl ester carboxylesterase
MITPETGRARTMPFATNRRDGRRVYFEDDGGQGSPVVVLGGFLDPVELVRTAPLARALQKLADEFRLVFIDHRGHGRSDKPHDPKAYEMSLRVADVVAALDELDIPRANLVGISWGGRLCFGLGEHAPERVRSLVIIGQQPYTIDPDGPLARVVGKAWLRRRSRASRRSSSRSKRSPAGIRIPCAARISSAMRQRCEPRGTRRWWRAQ